MNMGGTMWEATASGERGLERSGGGAVKSAAMILSCPKRDRTANVPPQDTAFQIFWPCMPDFKKFCQKPDLNFKYNFI